MWVIHAEKENDSRRMVCYDEIRAQKRAKHALKRGFKVSSTELRTDIIACNDVGLFSIIKLDVDYKNAYEFQRRWISKNRYSTVMLWPSVAYLPIEWNWSDEDDIAGINEKKAELERRRNACSSVQQQPVE